VSGLFSGGCSPSCVLLYRPCFWMNVTGTRECSGLVFEAITSGQADEVIGELVQLYNLAGNR
jgi:hypothetical protein